MKNFLSLLLLLNAAVLSSQTFFFAFTPLDTIPCPYDNSETIITPKSWTIYQTLNDTWNGPVDSSQCITVQVNGFVPELRLIEIDPNRSLFMRKLFPSQSQPLLNSDYIYKYEASLSEIPGAMVVGDTCANGWCTGVLFGIEIPDSAGTGTSFREYYTNADFIIPQQAGRDITGCVATEYFQENYLSEVVFKYTFTKDVQPDQVLSFGIATLDEIYNFQEINEVIFPEYNFNGTSYNASIEQVGNNGYFAEAYLLKYQGNGYPSSANQSFIEAQPEVNPDTPVILNLTLFDFQALVPQPFTSIRGALVEGSTTERHEFNLIAEGGELCILGLEVLFTSNSHFRYKRGKIDLTGQTACMQFTEGARLEIASNAHLDYGIKGEGALAIGKNSTIVLEKNSSLHLNNDLVLLERSTDKEEQIFIDLAPGTALSFGEKARLWKHSKVEGGQMKLNLLMNGGFLDDQNLSLAEQSLINKIYPQPAENLAENILLSQNPVRELLGFRVLSAAQEFLLVSLYNLKGELIWQQEKIAEPGFNTFAAPMQNHPAGLYLLRVDTPSAHYSQKIIKQ